jgi:hypothetical protein
MTLCCVRLLSAVVDIPPVPGDSNIIGVPSAVDIPAEAGVPCIFSTNTVFCVLILLSSCCCWHQFCSWCFHVVSAYSLLCRPSCFLSFMLLLAFLLLLGSCFS